MLILIPAASLAISPPTLTSSCKSSRHEEVSVDQGHQTLTRYAVTLSSRRSNNSATWYEINEYKGQTWPLKGGYWASRVFLLANDIQLALSSISHNDKRDELKILQIFVEKLKPAVILLFCDVYSHSQTTSPPLLAQRLFHDLLHVFDVWIGLHLTVA